LQAELDEVHARLQATNRELAASHQRLLAAADAELDRLRVDVRRRLDPQLALLADRLRDARAAARSDGDAVLTVATIAADLLPTSVELAEEIRTLARGVFPPILSDLGVAAAVRALVRRVGPDLAVELDDATGRGRFAADAEAACFLCCRALLDDALAARARRARVRLECDGRELLVAGSYAGGDLATPTEIGIARDRVSALGGRFRLDFGPSVVIDVAVPAA